MDEIPGLSASYYTGRSDVMSPGCLIDGKARHEWLDEEIELEFGDTGNRKTGRYALKKP